MAQQATSSYATIPRGVVLPFRRLGRGVATAGGVDAIVAQVQIVLGTTCASPDGLHGSLPYNQPLGTLVDRIRHQDLGDATTRELARDYVVEKLIENIPRLRIRGFHIDEDRDAAKLTIAVTFDVLDRKLRQAIAENISSQVTI